MGSHHLRTYSGLKGVELVGVVDADHERARNAADQYGCRAFNSHEQLVGEAEAVSVAVPSGLHAEVAGYLLENGIHCLVEKPLATTEAECQALIDAAERRDLVLLVGHVERFNPVVDQLRAIAQRSTIHAIDVRRMSALSSRIDDVDVVADLMIHDIDVVLSLMRSPVADVFAQGVRTHGATGQDYVAVNLAFEDGSMAQLAASRITQNKIRELHVTADLGFIAASYSTQELLIYRQGTASSIESSDGDADYKLELAIERVLIRAQEPLVRELTHFIDAVGSRGAPLVSGHDALEALRIVWSVQELLATGARHAHA